MFLIALVLTACSPTRASGDSRESNRAAPSNEASRRPTRVTLAIGAEVNNLAPKLEAANTYAAEINFLTNSPLVVLEPAGTARADGPGWGWRRRDRRRA